MKISNSEIARIIQNEGYNYLTALGCLDAWRDNEEEINEISVDRVYSVIKSLIHSFELSKQQNKI